MITICGVKISPFSGSCSCSRSILGGPGAVIRVGRKGGTKVFITGERAPGYRLSPDHFQKFKRSRLLIGHKKCFVLLCPIGEHISMSSFRVFVNDGYCLDHGLSSLCTKEIHAVRKLSVWYKIPIWPNSLTLSMNSSEPYQSSWREWICYCLFTPSQNVKLGIFTGSRTVQKSVMHVQSCCFALSSYYLFEFLIAAAS